MIELSSDPRSVEKELFNRILNHPVESFLHVFSRHGAASDDIPFVGFYVR